MSSLEYLTSVKDNAYRYVPKKKPPHPLLGLIQARTRKNRDTRIIIQGEAGIGKSWLALHLSECIDPQFVNNPIEAVDKQVFYKAAEFMKAITTLPKESVLLYDEPAQSWHHREFMKEINIVLSKTVIGYRYKKFITIFCVPFLESIDRDARALCNFMINMLDHGKCEVYRINIRKFGGDPFYQKIIDEMLSEQPSVKLRHAYEKKKEVTEDKLYEEFSKILDAKESDKKLTTDELLGVVKERPQDFTRKGRLYPPLLMGKLNIGRHKADSLVALLDPEAGEDNGN